MIFKFLKMAFKFLGTIFVSGLSVLFAVVAIGVIYFHQGIQFESIAWMSLFSALIVLSVLAVFGSYGVGPLKDWRQSASALDVSLWIFLTLVVVCTIVYFVFPGLARIFLTELTRILSAYSAELPL